MFIPLAKEKRASSRVFLEIKLPTMLLLCDMSIYSPMTLLVMLLLEIVIPRDPETSIPSAPLEAMLLLERLMLVQSERKIPSLSRVLEMLLPVMKALCTFLRNEFVVVFCSSRRTRVSFNYQLRICILLACFF